MLGLYWFVLILGLNCKIPMQGLSGVSYWPIEVRTGRGTQHSDFPKILKFELVFIKIKLTLSSLLKYILFHVRARDYQWWPNSQASSEATESKVKNTKWFGSPKKQMADSREPGGKQDQDTGDIFFHSTSLTRFRFCGFRVGHLSSILLFASSTCLLPPIEGIIRIKDFCTPATIESFNIWLSVQTELVYLLRCYWVQRGCCVEIWGNKYKSATGRKYKWCTRRNPSLQWLIVVHCTCSKWPLCCCCML